MQDYRDADSFRHLMGPFGKEDSRANSNNRGRVGSKDGDHIPGRRKVLKTVDIQGTQNSSRNREGDGRKKRHCSYFHLRREEVILSRKTRVHQGNLQGPTLEDVY